MSRPDEVGIGEAAMDGLVQERHSSVWQSRLGPVVIGTAR